MKTFRLDADDGKLHLRVGVAAPRGATRGDILYLHGFADRFDNHLPMIDAWVAQGYRVVAFDYPSHGESCGHGIDGYTFEDLASFALAVEKETREDARRPFLVSGWSTGGLLAVRMLQNRSFPALGRPIAGAVLFAPAVAGRMLVGEAGFVTVDTLTRNPSPPHRGEITPRSPLFTPLFASALVLSAKHAATSSYPTDVPTLLVLGGEDTDRYVDTARVEAWASRAHEAGARIYGRSCAGGYHELDNEPDGMGESVREASAAFATWAAEGTRGNAPMPVTRDDGACRAF
jgi:alpha-beta hydrolase superfamily lysophospholipase